MITRRSEKIVSIGSVLSKIPCVKTILKPINHLYIHYLNYNRNKAFKKNGISVLKEFDELMCKHGIHYTVFAGTLLGAIREGGLLKHDLDLDMMMFDENYNNTTQKLLENAGFKLLHKFEVNGGSIGREETYIKNDVSIDIYYVYKDTNYPTYQCDFWAVEGAFSMRDSMNKYGYVRVRRLEFPVSHMIRRVPFENIEVNIPENAEEWLCYRYGKDYMIPDPSFRDKGDNPNIFFWNEVKGIFSDN